MQCFCLMFFLCVAPRGVRVATVTNLAGLWEVTQGQLSCVNSWQRNSHFHNNTGTMRTKTAWQASNSNPTFPKCFLLFQETSALAACCPFKRIDSLANQPLITKLDRQKKDSENQWAVLGSRFALHKIWALFLAGKTNFIERSPREISTDFPLLELLVPEPFALSKLQMFVCWRKPPVSYKEPLNHYSLWVTHSFFFPLWL